MSLRPIVWSLGLGLASVLFSGCILPNGGTGGSGSTTSSTTVTTGTTMEKLCGGLLGLQCGANEYCEYEADSCGASDQTGVCTARPDQCFECGPTADCASLPVCGCDGVTYEDGCHAHQAGVDFAHTGACASTGQPCGGLAGLGCNPGEYCEYGDTQCGAGDQTGTCTPEPQDCPEVDCGGPAADCASVPVCGCDGVTYEDPCHAHLAGASVLHWGECDAPKTCGGDIGALCASDEYCDYTPQAMCGYADATGTCAKKPTECVPTDCGGADCVSTPVCGCDGVTYEDACHANLAGQGIYHDGQCDQPMP